MASKGNKSADATPLRLRLEGQPNWVKLAGNSSTSTYGNPVPVLVPMVTQFGTLANTEMNKLKIATANPVTFNFFEFFQSKLGGPTLTL